MKQLNKNIEAHKTRKRAYKRANGKLDSETNWKPAWVPMNKPVSIMAAAFCYQLQLPDGFRGQAHIQHIAMEQLQRTL